MIREATLAFSPRCSPLHLCIRSYTVKSVKTERDEIFLNYQTIIDRVQKEQDVSIVFSDDEKWLATITFEHFSPDELYNYLTEQF